MFDFYNNFCKVNNVDSLLISLDTEMAFDCVSHKYLYNVISAYGFSDKFISTVKLLLIKAHIMVNSYKLACIRILRSVKQGDALAVHYLSCVSTLWLER